MMGMRTLPLSTEDPVFALDSWPIIDWSCALKNMGGNQTILHEMIETMVKDEIPSIKIAFATAHTAQDWTSIENLAHKMRGGAIYIGLLKMKQACQTLEEACHAQQPLTQREALYAEVMGVCDKTQQTLEAWLSTA